MAKSGLRSIAVAALASALLSACVAYPEDRGYNGGGYDRGPSYGGDYSYGTVYVDEYYYWHGHDRYSPHRHDRRGDRWDHRSNGPLYYGRPGEAPGSRRGDGGYYRDRRHADDGYFRDQRQADGGYRRDWRQGDGDFHRNQRQQAGVGLEERTRRDRQERIYEDSRERSDDAIRRRDRGISGAPEISGNAPYGEGRSGFDERQQQRSTGAERDAQRRAAEVRRRLLAERQAAAQSPATAQRQRQLRREGMDQADEQRQRQLEREGIDPYQVPPSSAQTQR